MITNAKTTYFLSFPDDEHPKVEGLGSIEDCLKMIDNLKSSTISDNGLTASSKEHYLEVYDCAVIGVNVSMIVGTPYTIHQAIEWNNKT